ncbi:hypothetical protein F5884DRAFT_480082 [Xylogone sp. PMI_703]|nr:hypothetical protein F5884DRAFT_480082 [Xylogone sp. PMI_703]
MEHFATRCDLGSLAWGLFSLWWEPVPGKRHWTMMDLAALSVCCFSSALGRLSIHQFNGRRCSPQELAACGHERCSLAVVRWSTATDMDKRAPRRWRTNNGEADNAFIGSEIDGSCNTGLFTFSVQQWMNAGPLSKAPSATSGQVPGWRAGEERDGRLENYQDVTTGWTTGLQEGCLTAYGWRWCWCFAV